MNSASVPASLVSRSKAGLFPPEEEARVLDALLEDLNTVDPVGGQTPADSLLERYKNEVHNNDRLDRAAKVIGRVPTRQLDPSELEVLVEILYFSGYQRLLAKHHLGFPAYNILDDYFVNARAPWGPLLPVRPTAGGRRWSLLGRFIGFPIGVPASVLTDNSSWVSYFLRNGFNVITYRTVRTRAWQPHRRPNWVFVPTITESLPIGEPDSREVVADPDDWVPAGDRAVATANSFGVPSISPYLWQADVEESLRLVHDDQLLMVSVMGDDYDGTGEANVLAADYARAAKLAYEAGARVIELNMSCPNSLDKDKKVQRPLCLDPELTGIIVERVRAEVGLETRLVAKLSHMSRDDLQQLVPQVVRYVDAISGINTLQRPVVRRDGQETFPDRPRAGVSGVAIRSHALEFVANLAHVRAEVGTWFDIIAMGGVTSPESFADLFNAGANAVQTASGAFANPFLAYDCIQQVGSSLPGRPPVSKEVFDLLRLRVQEAVSKLDRPTRYSVATKVGAPASLTFEILDRLVDEGQLFTLDERGERFYRSKAQADVA